MELLIDQFMNETQTDETYDPKGQRESGFYSVEFKDKYIKWLEEKLKSHNKDYAKCRDALRLMLEAAYDADNHCELYDSFDGELLDMAAEAIK